MCFSGVQQSCADLNLADGPAKVTTLRTFVCVYCAANGVHWDPRSKLYHMFYQHSMQGAVWQWNLVWGHAVSEDLLRWHHLAPAVHPTPGGVDADGEPCARTYRRRARSYVHTPGCAPGFALAAQLREVARRPYSECVRVCPRLHRRVVWLCVPHRGRHSAAQHRGGAACQCAP